MAYVTPIGSSDAQVEYRLTGGHGCPDKEIDYRTDARERPLRWIGKGLPAVGITPGAVMTGPDMDRARALMKGTDPATGEQLVEPKLAVFEDAKVQLAPLVAAVEAKAQQTGTSVEDLLGSNRAVSAFRSASRAVTRQGVAAKRRADQAGQLADAAGLDVDSVWGSGAYAAAVGNLTETRTVKGEDGTTREEVVPRRKVIGNAGYDLTYTLPKSMSLLLAFADDATADRVEGIYSEQIGRTFGWVESQTAYQMRGHHGNGQRADRVDGEGFLGWTMVHRAARPVDGETVGDPHWHVHVTIANLTRAEDGGWSTVAAGGRDLMRHAPAADHVLKALVRRELATTFGVEFARNERTNAWEVAAIPDETLVTFSRRGLSIAGVLAEFGVSAKEASEAEKRIAQAQARGDKSVQAAASDQTLREHWQQRAEATGHDLTGMVARILAGDGRPGDEAEVDAIRADLLDPESGLTAHARRFSRLEAIAAVADALEDGIDSVDTLTQLTDVVLNDPRFVDVQRKAVGGESDRTLEATGGRGLNHEHLSGAQLRSTADVAAAEEVIFNHALNETRDHVQVDADRAAIAIDVAESAQGYPLSEEQRLATLHLTGSAAPVDTLLGPPGTGKTTLLRAARTVWEADGHTVMGVATAAVAAHNLNTESGIASHTVAQLLHRAGQGEDPLAGVDVLVLDEANLTDDRARARLYELAAAAHTKIVEVGDPKQLRGVGCGSVFGELHELVDGAELTENRRQIEMDERLALRAFREGAYLDALASWSGRGRLVATETAAEAQAKLAAAYLAETAGAPDVHDRIRGVVMLAATNDRVRNLNDTVQALRADAGQVTDLRDYRTAGGDELRVGVGDLVLLRVNDRAERWHTGAAVLNGHRGVVTGFDDDGGLQVEWREDTDDGTQLRAATLNPDYIGRGGVELGYAMTTHKAEGLTVAADWTKPDGQTQRGTVLGYLPGMDNAGMYVAASRHKDQFVGFASREEMEAPRLTEEKGLPGDAAELHARVQTALADVAHRTAENANDTPVTEERMPAERPDLAAIRARARASREQREQALTNRQAQEQQRDREQEPAAERGDDIREREYARQAEAEARDRGIER